MTAADKSEVLTYFDQDGLMGSQPNPTKWSEGNPWLQTATFLAVASRRHELDDGDAQRFRRAYDACKTAPGMINRNPGRPDDISHDEISGLVAGARICGLDDITDDVVAYATAHGWVLSNTGKWYFDADAKPWHRGLYVLCSQSYLCPLLEHAAYVLSVVVDAFRTDANAKRQTWVGLVAARQRSAFVDVAARLWTWRLRRTYGSVERLLVVYYNDERAVLARYASGIKGDPL